MEEGTPTTEQQDNSPAPNAGASPTNEWEGRYKGLQPKYQQKVEEVRSLQEQLSGVEQSLQLRAQELEKISGARDSALSELESLSSQHAAAAAKIARYEAFSEVPGLMHLMNNPAINPTGETHEERVASLQALAASLSQDEAVAAKQIEARVEEEVRDAQTNLSPSVKAQPAMSLDEQLAAVEDEMYRAMRAGEPWEAHHLKMMELQSERIKEREGAR